jgi:15-cis-phytoene synthase
LDTLTAMEEGDKPDHPVAVKLFETIKRRSLPLAALRAMAEVHTRRLYANRPVDIEELEHFFGLTQSRLIQLVALLLDKGAAQQVAEAAGYAGVATGISDMVSERTRFSNLLPTTFNWDQLQKHGLKRMAEAREIQIPTAVFPAFLLAALATSKLDRPDVVFGAMRSQFSLWRAMRRGSL